MTLILQSWTRFVIDTQVSTSKQPSSWRLFRVGPETTAFPRYDSLALCWSNSHASCATMRDHGELVVHSETTNGDRDMPLLKHKSCLLTVPRTLHSVRRSTCKCCKSSWTTHRTTPLRRSTRCSRRNLERVLRSCSSPSSTLPLERRP